VKLDPRNKEIRIIKRFSRVKGKDILEIGCGSGRLSFPLSKGAKSYVGIDTDRKAVAEASRRTKTLKNVSFKHGSGAKLAFDDATFDGVFMFMALHEIPPATQARTLSEAKRVLKLGGGLVIVEPLPYGEVQSLYDVFNSALRHMDHPRAVLHAQKVMADSMRKGAFKPVKRMKYRIDWHFTGIDELFDLFCKENGVSAMDKRRKMFLSRLKELLGRKSAARPLIVFDEMLLSILKRI
jgi:SAM-dependent methyltransferase